MSTQQVIPTCRKPVRLRKAWIRAAAVAAVSTLVLQSVGCSSPGGAATPPPAGGLESDGGLCSGPATEALIDDMTGPSISFTPPPCASKGGWFVYSTGTLTTPTGDASALDSCGSYCQSLYSPRPAGFPGASASNGGSQPQALCISGQTSAALYGYALMVAVFAFSGAVPDGGPTTVDLGDSGDTTGEPPEALVDASKYNGIQFWLWVSPETVAGVTSSFHAWLSDKWLTPGYVADGGCDPNSLGPTACGFGAASVHGSTAAVAEGAGDLLASDGGVPTALSVGWQQLRAPWASFMLNPYFGGAIEQVVDPTSLDALAFAVQQQAIPGAGDGGDPPILFDYCVTDVEFYR